MKQLTFILCLAMLFCSCIVSKKASNQQTNKDSTESKSSVVTGAKKIEAADTSTTKTTVVKTAESGYKKKTTTVKELFSDDFDFDSGAVKKAVARFGDTAGIFIGGFLTLKANKRPLHIYRETTTVEEEGAAKAAENAAITQTAASKINATDTAHGESQQNAHTATAEQISKKTSLDLSLFPWWLWLLLGLGVLAYLYFKVKK